MDKPHRIAVTKHCLFCLGETKLYLNGADIKAYNAGAFVQDVWPDKSMGFRETIITGTHGFCFDEAFKEDDDG